MNATFVAPIAPCQRRRAGYAVRISGVRYWIVRMIDQWRAVLRRAEVQTTTTPARQPARTTKPAPAPIPAPAPVVPLWRAVAVLVLTRIARHLEEGNRS